MSAASSTSRRKLQFYIFIFVFSSHLILANYVDLSETLRKWSRPILNAFLVWTDLSFKSDWHKNCRTLPCYKSKEDLIMRFHVEYCRIDRNVNDLDSVIVEQITVLFQLKTYARASNSITRKEANSHRNYRDVFGAFWCARSWMPTSSSGNEFINSVISENTSDTRRCVELPKEAQLISDSFDSNTVLKESYGFDAIKWRAFFCKKSFKKGLHRFERVLCTISYGQCEKKFQVRLHSKSRSRLRQ